MRLTRTWLVLCAACGSVADSDRDRDSGIGDGTCDPRAAFSAPAQLAGFATAGNEGVARLTRDELTMYFSGVLGSSVNPDLFFVVRSSADRPFGAPTRLAASSATAVEYDPTISPDGLALMFSSNRDGPMRLYAATRTSTIVDFDTPGPVSGVASTDANVGDAQPFVTSEGLELWFASVRPGGLGNQDIWRSTRSGASFGTPALVAELNSPSAEALPMLSYDKLTAYFSSDRPGSTGLDVWRAHRTTAQDGFGAAERVPELSISAANYASWISPDNCRIYLASETAGNVDMYIARRSPR